MMNDSTFLVQYIDANHARFLEELNSLLMIPSISTEPKHKEDINRCAELIKRLLLKSGCNYAEVFITSGYPIVYGEVITDPGGPTVLVYGHYDVVPADPVDIWETDPFKPEIRNGRIYARGASDDKGQLFMHLKALEILIKSKELRTNLKFLIEGEEEIGSPSLKLFLKQYKKLLESDTVLISDSIMLSKETPSIEIGFRGFCALDIEVIGANRELHSGGYGGIVANPITVLSKMLATFHDDKNRINIPGFYENVLNPNEKEIQIHNKSLIDEVDYTRKLGVKRLWGEEGYSLIERSTIRPTIEVNGIWGGYSGAGMKSIIPSKAQAKISSRLVPDQSSVEVTNKITDYLYAIAPPEVEIRITHHPGCEPYTADLNNPFFNVALITLEEIFNKPPLLVKDGGSLPLCHWIESELGIKSILLGFGLQEDNMHGPDESFDLENFENGIKTIMKFHEYIGTHDFGETIT